MAKNYFYTASLFCLFAVAASAQDRPGRPQENGIEGLNFYPNPVSSGKIYITSKSSLDKDIAIFDVLGKKVLQVTLDAKELNIASLSPGVYIIKIHEGDATATRKLIVK